MKPVRVVTLWWMLLLGAARKGAAQESTFYYGTFPAGFSWGVGSSAYQTEGAWDQDGKGPSIWDAFTHSGTGKVLGDDTADVACDSYYKVQEDVMLLRELNVSHYRFSLSWPRLLPTGIRAEQVNEKGIRFYSELIDALLRSDITPIVTLHHWDLPQLLQVKYGGWQNASMATYFRDYADLCFAVFGDRVKHWITFSDPRAMVEKGYETGLHAPGLRLPGTGLYKAAHHIIKAHAHVWHSYNDTWRGRQRGLVGISLNCDWGEPVDVSDPKDVEAAERYLQFCLGWFANPIYAGDYPQVMKDRIGRKSVEQGLEASSCRRSHCRDTSVPVPTGSQQLRARCVPPFQTQYGDPPIYVTENGAPQRVPCSQLCDEWRIHYLKGYINEMLKAVKDGANIRGYTAWSLLDKFEWDKGYSDRYGLYYVRFIDRNRPRHPKASMRYYKKIIAANGFPSPREVDRWHREALDMCSIDNQMLAAEPLLSHMQLVTEIVVPTVCALCVLIAAVLLLLLLSRRS
uniref:Lactase like n=1 Tax=Oryctolagus cuniculus TaxID=9986 RepID=G1TSM4_RABIT